MMLTKSLGPRGRPCFSMRSCPTSHEVQGLQDTTRWGGQETLVGTQSKKKVQQGPGTAKQTDVCELAPRDHWSRPQLLRLTHKELVPLELVLASSQDVGAEVLLHLDQSTLDLALGMAESRGHGTHEVWESSENTETGTQFLEPEPVPSISRELPSPWSSTS